MAKVQAAKKGASSTGLISMTGFGRGSANGEGVQVDAEIRTVNHRYLDLSFKLPRPYGQFEPDLRQLIAGKFQRGRVEVIVTRQVTEAQQQTVNFNKSLFDSLYNIYTDCLSELGKVDDATRQKLVFEILGRREVLEAGAELGAGDAEGPIVSRAVADATAQVLGMRSAEGTKLGVEIRARLGKLMACRGNLAKFSAKTPAELYKKLLARVKKLISEITVDQNRLVAELGLIAERVDVSEELARLDSHFKQFSDALKTSGNGRKLDFLLQEIGREFNTVGSKAQDAAAQTCVVEAKVELEKLREQVQNIE